jgi:5-methylcytosine-specific restriction endonuclease McrA
MVPIEKIKKPDTFSKHSRSKKIMMYINYFNENKCLPTLILNESYEIKKGRTRYQVALKLGISELNCDIYQETKRKSISKNKRLLVFYECEGRCKICGKSLQNTDRNDINTYMTVDHIIPLVKGGTYDISNLQGMCLECNMKKSGMMPEEFEKVYSESLKIG